MRLLLVDDDDMQIHWLEKQFLSADDHDVFSCYNAKEALETYKTTGPETFDVVITDFQMPGMTGLELIEEIRKLRPDQHVILQTSETKRLVPSSIPQLHKPYPIRLLLRALRMPVQPLLPLQ
jgi:DNA-binding NtrC family response regulator